MIGGYLYSVIDPDVEKRLTRLLADSFQRIPAWNHGSVFFNDPFGDGQTSYCAKDDFILLSQDLLVTRDSGGEYRSADMKGELADHFQRSGIESFKTMEADFRMVAVSKIGGADRLFLFSHRAGSGRMYFHLLKNGIIFCSDLRFLLRIKPFQVDPIGIYAILKYGAVPEPMTICETVTAVPCGHYLEYRLGNHTYSLHPFYRFHFSDQKGEISEKDASRILSPTKSALQRSARFLARSNPTILLSGGIDSSLYACYLNPYLDRPLKAFYCAFGGDDPELPFAKSIADRIRADLEIIRMEKPGALQALEDVALLTDHPFSDQSSLPIAFLLKNIKALSKDPALLIEGNGGDDCFGFQDLRNQNKFFFKHQFPRLAKSAMAAMLKNFPNWKWKSHEGTLARLSALADDHELAVLNYFLVMTPVNYLGLQAPKEWDEKLQEIMEPVFAGVAEGYGTLSYEGKTTIRQLLHINSRLWAAKALSVGESLGLRVAYPYIWQGILVEQGKLPWSAKIHKGIVKWPLKRLLQEFMPDSFIYRKKSGFIPPFGRWLADRDFNYAIREILTKGNGHLSQIVPARTFEELLTDALEGRELRHSVLSFLWGAVFTEFWLRKQNL